jgi:hypothetical protein
MGIRQETILLNLNNAQQFICFERTPSTEGRPVRHQKWKTADLSTSLRSPGFPVELGGVGARYAAFLNESSTRGNVQRCVAGNPGPVEMTNLLQQMPLSTQWAEQPSVAQQICHLDRSVAEWRDLRFLFGSYTPSSAPVMAWRSFGLRSSVIENEIHAAELFSPHSWRNSASLRDYELGSLLPGRWPFQTKSRAL